ncbi:MAG TPA: MFS transporter [Thermoplasmata archaeon]|nr:MFS transporter [Thermoplasmata archaeon]
MSPNGPDVKMRISSKTKRRLLSGVSTNVLVLGVVSLLTDMSSEMIYPILPLFLTAIGATGLIIGLIEGAAETTASLLKVASGWYSDKFNRRKPFILGGYGASAAVKPALIVATMPWQVLGIRITERIGKGIRSAPRDALIADSTTPERMGKAFGFHKAMDSTGAVIGPIVALIILAYAASMEELEAYRLIFILATLPAFAAVLVALVVKDKEATRKVKRGRFAAELRSLGREFWLVILVVMTFYVGEISYAFFVLQSKGAGMSDTTTILLYVLFNLVFVFVAMPSGSLSDRIGRKPIIVVSFLLFALTSVVMAKADSLLLLVLGFSLFGVYKGSSEGVLKAYVVDFVPKDLRGSALGAFHTAVGLVMLPGGIVAGLLWDSVGPWATFTFGAVMALIASSLLFVLAKAPRVSENHRAS